MGLTTQWLLLTLIVQFMGNIIYPHKHENGYITRFMKKLVRAPRETFSLFRLAQMLFFLFNERVIYSTPYHLSYYIPVIILYLDDIFSEDDDTWKRRFRTAKNKIKWKMKLPQTQPQS